MKKRKLTFAVATQSRVSPLMPVTDHVAEIINPPPNQIQPFVFSKDKRSIALSVLSLIVSVHELILIFTVRLPWLALTPEERAEAAFVREGLFFLEGLMLALHLDALVVTVDKIESGNTTVPLPIWYIAGIINFLLTATRTINLHLFLNPITTPPFFDNFAYGFIGVDIARIALSVVHATLQLANAFR